MNPTLPAIKHEIVSALAGPSKAYTGVATAVQTYNGIPVVVLAANRAALVDVIKEINPQVRIDPALFLPASIIHSSQVVRPTDEDEL